MTIADKLSWIGGMVGLFTGFSVISGIEILYWIFFIILCKKKNDVDPDIDEKACDEGTVKESNKVMSMEQKFMEQEEMILY